MSAEKTSVTTVENGDVHSLKGMYKDYFLDYASYVILERAVPSIDDGLKPVQRRILHSMKEKDDGRYHKVANIIGHTMQYHPHGDAAIGDALVNLGQKDLLIDPQGNWGDVRTGDRAAAPRYIEARLTKFALDVGFKPQITEWQLSYDGRNKEPVSLPLKFPLVLAQGAEGIAVGLSTKIMPHNFIELLQAAIKILQDKRFKIYPDFQTGGLIDVTDYQAGKRGGKLRARAKIEQVDKKTLAIRELPYGQTTTSIMDSVVKATEKGKIKIKRLIDNTAKHVEILVDLAPGISPEVTIDALYAFTNCEVSISPNACVIVDNKPHFLSVDEILKLSAERTRDLLRQELELRKNELEAKWHFASLEKIFIENRIYRDIEECESWEQVIAAIDIGLAKYVATPSTQKKGDKRVLLKRDITEEDIARLTEIKIKRISKYNVFKAEEGIAAIEEELAEVMHHLAHLTEYTINYYQRLLDTYGKGKERRTEIAQFDTIQATNVVAINSKLYVNRKEGFAGFGLKKDEFIKECSDLDDIIAFRRDGQMMVAKIADKVFFGKNIEHIDVWSKADDRTTYNMIYVDAKTGRAMAKRFNVTSITRNKEYDLTAGAKGSKALYFQCRPNGESEVVEVQLSPGSSAKKKVFTFDFGELSIKGRSSKGNIVTKYPVRKIVLKEVGKSTLGAMEVWMDEVSGRLNKEERGTYLGQFDTGDQLLAIYKDGTYEIQDLDQNAKFEPKNLLHIGKFKPENAISAIYYEGEKGWTMVKRFIVETTSIGQRFKFITEHKSSTVLYATVDPNVAVQYTYMQDRSKKTDSVDLDSFIDVKGWKAIGNRLSDKKVRTVEKIESKAPAAPPKAKNVDAKPDLFSSADEPKKDDKLGAGDTVEW